MQMKTVRTMMDANNGAMPGFDALRLLLASAVMLWHSIYIFYGSYSETYQKVWHFPPVYIVLKAILPMFFCLGGFLVTGSAQRVRAAVPFFFYRALRIVPALLVEVILCAVILGGCLTTLPLKTYYTQPDFYNYFLNIIGDIHFVLPGVFENMPYSNNVVNVNLWTLPPDLFGYAIMIVLIILGAVFDKKLFLKCFIFGQLYFLILLPAMQWGDSGFMYVHPKMLIYSFLTGIAFYMFAENIVMHKALVAFSVAALSCLMWKYTTLIGVIAACYLTIYIGHLDLSKVPFTKKGDYSYGIYLYGFPIERTISYTVPALHQWWQLFVIAYAVTLGFAALSWHLVERPCLRLKKWFKAKPAAAPLADVAR